MATPGYYFGQRPNDAGISSPLTVHGATNNVRQFFQGDDDPWANFATDTWARITRERYEDTKATYWPIEDYLKGIVNNPMERATAVQGARNLADSSFQGLEGTLERRLASYGTKLTPEQQASQDKRLSLSKSLADVDAGNRANDAVTQRDLSLAGGGLARNVGALDYIQQQRPGG